MENLIFYVTHGISLLCTSAVFYVTLNPTEEARELKGHKGTAVRHPVKIEDTMKSYEKEGSAIAAIFGQRQLFKSSVVASREMRNIEQLETNLITDLKA